MDPRLVNLQGRGRQFVAARLVQLAGTRAGGFVLTRQEPAGKWGVAMYSFVRTGRDLCPGSALDTLF
jgi:hypothetical protein